ncbi:M23 family metallopeptidase [Melioribacteraceae bacterium 4301-Me]|uniref:M23 family metallopeptidase n=1 Tax=Pyranulibacter aquaticus TaxID=3163344 RepID=UPI00359B53AA
MKKFYYFSKAKLKFVEIKDFYRKFLFLVLFFSFLISFLVFGTFLVYNEYVNPDWEVKSLQRKNNQLKDDFRSLLEKYKQLSTQVDNLFKRNNELRLLANLEPFNNEDSLIGIGGNIFSDFDPTTPSDIKELLNNISSYVAQLNAKVTLEKESFNEVKETLKSNEKLYAAIPALKPVVGGFFGDSFGLRMHPILKIKRMHDGQDIVVDIGTKVYAPGAGKVSFVGRRGGTGLTLEIDHGFGYTTIYGHLSQILVKLNQNVKRGDVIALSGNSGKLSTGPHLHYEVRHNGIPLDPRNFMYDDINIFDIVKKNDNSKEMK